MEETANHKAVRPPASVVFGLLVVLAVVGGALYIICVYLLRGRRSAEYATAHNQFVFTSTLVRSSIPALWRLPEAARGRAAFDNDQRPAARPMLGGLFA